MGIPGAKAAASRAVRKAKDLSNGGAHKRCYPQYSICDYRFYYPEGYMDWAKWTAHRRATGEDKEFRRPWTTNRK